MDKDQAADIQGYLLEAAGAIDDASAIAFDLSREEREILVEIASACISSCCRQFISDIPS
jgi:hypothetical protein